MSGIEAGAVDAFDDSFDAMGQFTNTVAGDLRDPYPGLAEKRRESRIELVMQEDFGGGSTPMTSSLMCCATTSPSPRVPSES
jgi:hypothetical protein